MSERLQRRLVLVWYSLRRHRRHQVVVLLLLLLLLLLVLVLLRLLMPPPPCLDSVGRWPRRRRDCCGCGRSVPSRRALTCHSHTP
jgi:hypothetical protein